MLVRRRLERIVELLSRLAGARSRRLSATSMAAPPPQLHMRRRLHDLPAVALPPRYVLRTMTPGDAAAWARLLSLNGQLGEWPLERAQRYFAPGSAMRLASSYLVELGGEPVATAQLHEHRDGPYAPTPELGWVAVSRDHRRQGLGTAVCLAVMRAAAERGEEAIFLRTDDHRLAAIHTYLRLGFEPWHRDESDGERWQAIAAALADLRA